MEPALVCLEQVIGAAKLSKTGACHLFRHTMATLMHENWADIRFIQEILGHVKLETTQIYTHVSIRTLQKVHAATHPTALLGHKPEQSQAAGRRSPIPPPGSCSPLQTPKPKRKAALMFFS